MEKILKQVGNFNVTLISEEITKIDLSKSPFNLKSEKNEYSCTSLIIATGASPKPLDIPGEQIYLGRGVSTCAICDGFFYKGKEVIIAGGGNTAAEDALYLAKMAKQVTIVHRRDTLRAEEWLISQLKATPNIKWELNATVTEILGDDHGVTGVIIKKVDTQIASKIAVDGVFIAIGYKPNTELFQDQIITKQGYIKTGYGSLTATSLPGVFAAGDVVINNYRQAIVAAGLGCTAALDAKNFLLTVTNQ